MGNKCSNCPQSKPILKECTVLVLPKFEYDEIQQDLIFAIKEFYKNDIDLLLRGCNEMCITSHIFHYFSLLFAEKYSGYNIDPEYNRNGFGSKYYYGDKYAKPDLIIHKRNCNKHNLLYAEFKTNIRSHDCHDKEKILKFVSNDFGNENGRCVPPYSFSFGISILLCQDTLYMQWYKNGENTPFEENRFSTKTWERI